MVNILYKTNMDKFPGNCNDCTMSEAGCNRPLNRQRDRVLKPYLTKRHKDCPLILMGIDLASEGNKSV